MFKPDMPLLYDLRYLEMSYLTMQHAKTAFDKLLELILQVGESDIPHPDQVPIDVAGVCALFASTRHTFDAWVKLHHASLQDDLWGQYWLAGVAAGLSYCHKANLGFEERLAGLIFAAANLKRFASLFGMPLPAQAQQLIGPDDVRQGVPARLSSSPAGDKSMHKLPTQATPFIGRTAQLTAILAMVRDPAVRLITLLGPGGTGKTRLSLRLAESVSDDFAHGVAFVPLADDRDANQLVSRVAQVLEVREGGRPLLENIKDYVREKHLLLVLDNFEQLVSASPVIADLLASAPELKVITSSRIALNLQGEVEYPVPPLDLPGGDQELSLEALAGNEAVALFIERARANQPGFALTSSNQSAVVEICRRLDGLPLALELAAARIKLLTPQAILARLDDRLKLLTGGARDLPSRQQTLRNTLEWSYSLLSAEEKTLFARLAVFVGGFTLDAAERVCSLEGDIDVLEGLTALVNNSLLRQSSDAQGEPRFGMLETICAYALEHLQASGELPRMQEQHAAYYSNVVLEQAGMNLYTPHALSCLNLLTRENDNIRATLAWCLGSAEGAVLGANMLFPLEWFWYRRGLTLEGLDWSEKFLATPAVQADPQLHAITLSISGFMALWLGRQEDALSRLEKSLFIHQRIEDDFMIAALTMGTGVALLNMGRDAEAQPRLEMASRVMKELNQTYFQTLTVIHLGNVELGLGNFERARALHTQAEELARSIGEDWLLSFALNNLGEVARTQGQYEQAGKYYEECMALLEHTGDQGDQARFVHNLGYISQHKSDFLRAEKQFRKSLVMFRKLGNRRGMAECMAALAGLRARQGQAEWGAVMLSAAEQVIKSSGGAWWPADRVEVERNHTLIAAALDKATLLSAQMRGKAMGLEQALQFASSSV